MLTNEETPKIPLPRGWKKHVRSAVLHLISLAQYVTFTEAVIRSLLGRPCRVRYNGKVVELATEKAEVYTLGP